MGICLLLEISMCYQRDNVDSHYRDMLFIHAAEGGGHTLASENQNECLQNTKASLRPADDNMMCLQ
jgi:hypothetical protein